MPLWFPVDVLRRHPNVEYGRRTWYVMDALEEAGHPHAKAVRKMVKANPAPKPPKSYKMPTDPDPELTAAQREINGPCPACGEQDRRIAQRVKKEGATRGRRDHGGCHDEISAALDAGATPRRLRSV